jgi:transposase-like protein
MRQTYNKKSNKPKNISHNAGRVVKHGFTKGKQRFINLETGCTFIKEYEKRGYPQETRNFAVRLFLEGLGYRAIGRSIEVSYQTVRNWVLAAASNTPLPTVIPGAHPLVELDEVCLVMPQKKSGFGWPPAHRHGK